MGAHPGEASGGALEGRAAEASWRGEGGRKTRGREGGDRREKDERREIKGKWSYSRSILQEEEGTDTQKTQKKPVSKPEL